MAIVLRETSRLDNMLSEFLLYARPLTPVKSWFSLKRLVGDLVSLFEKDSRFKSVIIENAAESLEVYADHDQFRQILWNLIINAAESMAAGGSIRIATYLESESAAADSLKITVEDNGAGIPEKYLDMLFEPFFTTKSGGTGLGLATVYRILENHGATISVTSSPGCGTCFTITMELPQRECLTDSDNTQFQRVI
jgi:two-component system sensor histidine kinase PilS (NtrC family)